MVYRRFRDWCALLCVNFDLCRKIKLGLGLKTYSKCRVVCGRSRFSQRISKRKNNRHGSRSSRGVRWKVMSTECTFVRMMASLNVNRTSLSNENKQKRRRNHDGVTRLPFNHRVVEPPSNAACFGYHCELHQQRVFVSVFNRMVIE